MENEVIPSCPNIDYNIYKSAEIGTVFGRIEFLSDTLVIGWVCSKGSPIDSIEVYFKKTWLQTCDVFSKREDVTRFSGGNALGFSITLDLSESISFADLHSGIQVITRPGNVQIYAEYANVHSYPEQSQQARKRRSFRREDQPLVSVIMPVYDRTQKLRESIRSVLAQTYQSIELVIVGDNPPSETLLILESFKSDPRIKIFIYPDRSGNACRGRNTGILLARGELIAFQDSDDIAFPDRIRDTVYMFTKCANGRVDLLYTSVRVLTDGSREINGISFGQRIDAGLISISEMETVNPMFTCTVCVRRDLLFLVGGFRREMIYREDQELWLRLAYSGAVFGIIPIPLSLYRLHEGNAELGFLGMDEEWKKRMLLAYRETFAGEWTWSAS